MYLVDDGYEIQTCIFINILATSNKVCSKKSIEVLLAMMISSFLHYSVLIESVQGG